MLRFCVGFMLLIGLLITIGIVGARREDADAPADIGAVEESNKGVNLIAYVNHEGEVWTTTPDGSDRHLLSPSEVDGFYTWPTWAPDANSLVFSGVTGSGPIHSTSRLFVSNLGYDGSYEIYAGEPGVTGLLAVGVVHYLQWSPNSEQLAFVTATSRGLNLFIDDISDDIAPQVVVEDGPFWITWSPNSQYLLVHRGTNHLLVDTQGDIQVSFMDISPSHYRVPAWQTKGNAVTIAAIDSNGNYTLYSAHMEGDEMSVPEPIVTSPSEVSFMWSPTGEHLALADTSEYLTHKGSVFNKYERLTLFPKDGTGIALQVQRGVLSFFWSPDGNKVAYLTTTSSEALRWMILDVESGSEWPLVDFVPSREQLSVFEFFDQYAYSHSPWSPDSTSLVFAGTVVGGGITASYGSAQNPRYNIITVNTAASAFVEIIAEGILGFWSPR